MSDWEFEMWWDAVNGMEEEEEEYDDMDDWQSKRARAPPREPYIFPQN